MNSKQILAKLKAFPLAISLIVAAIALSGWTYWRSTGALADAQESFDQVTQQNALISQNSKTAELLDEQLAELNADGAKLTAGLISTVEDISNQQYFYDLEHAAGVDQIADPIHTATTHGKDPAEPAVATFTLSVGGQWDNLLKFVYGLQTGPHPLRITLFQLVKAQQLHSSGGATNLLNLTLTVEMLGK